MKNFKAGTVTRPTEKLNMRIAVGGQRGYTLIEIVVVIVVLGIIGGVTFQIVAAGVEAFKKSSARKDLYDQGRLALERMVRELRDGKEITDCSSNSITFKKAHPAQAADNIEEIKYWFDDANKQLKRVGDPNGNEGGPYSAVLASNVTDFPMPEGTMTGGSVGVTPASTDTVTAGATTMTIAHTVSGTNHLMLVGVSMNNDGYETVTGITWNGTALTLVGTEATTDDARVEIWRLFAPSTGTHNVVITFSAGLEQEAHAGVMTFAGVHETTPLGTFVSAHHDGSTPATVDIPSASGEIVFGVVASEYEALTASSGQDEQWNLAVSSTYGAGGTAAGAAPTVTMSWNLASADHWAIGGVSIKPAPSTVDCTGGTGVISFDAASSANSGSSPLSWPHTVGVGTNRLLVVAIGVEDDSANGDINGVTYNGVALTKAVDNFVENFQNTEIWYLLNPPEGIANVEVTTNGAPDNLNVGAMSVFGAAQAGPEATASQDDGGADWTTIQTNITTLTDGAWVFDVVGSGEPRTFTPDAGQTERFDVTGGSSGAAASSEEVPTAGLEILGWTVDGTSTRISHVLAAFAPASQSSFPLITLQLTLSSEQGGTVTMRTKVFMRNIP